MAWRIVQQPNSKFARFSEVVDDFTHYDMSEAEAICMCRNEYGMPLRDAEVKVSNALKEPNRFANAINSIKVIHGGKLAKKRTRQLSSKG